MEMMTKNICFKIHYISFLVVDLKINCLLRKKCWACSNFTTKSRGGVGYFVLVLKRKSAEILGTGISWRPKKSSCPSCIREKLKRLFQYFLKSVEWQELHHQINSHVHVVVWVFWFFFDVAHLSYLFCVMRF